MEKVEFTVPGGRFGSDHVHVTFVDGDDFVTIQRDARDIETIWHLDRELWPAFLERIEQSGADSVVEGVKRAVAAGAGVSVLQAVRDLATVKFAEIDWDLGFGSAD